MLQLLDLFLSCICSCFSLRSFPSIIFHLLYGLDTVKWKVLAEADDKLLYMYNNPINTDIN